MGRERWDFLSRGRRLGLGLRRAETGWVMSFAGGGGGGAEAGGAGKGKGDFYVYARAM